MSNPWFRMYAEFATDAKVQMMSEAYQRRFVMVLCLRCSNGNVTLHDEEVAFQLRISNDEWAATKAVFVAKSLLDDNNSPTAWDKRQYVSDSSAERVARHRDKKKKECNVTVTPPDTDTDTDKQQLQNHLCEESHNAKPEQTEKPKKSKRGSNRFEEFWLVFSDKRGKAEAKKAWDRLNPDDDLADLIISQAGKYARYRDAIILPSGQTPKMAQGWISGKRWEDEIPAMEYTKDQLALIKSYNLNIGTALPHADPTGWTKQRADLIDAALVKWTVEKWSGLFEWVRDNCVFDFPADLFWILVPDNFLKVHAGNYQKGAKNV